MSENDPVTQFEQGLLKVSEAFRAGFEAAADEQALRAENARWVGASGELTQLMKLMRTLPNDKKREFGQRANAVKNDIQTAFDARLADMARAARDAELSGAPLDVTLPGRDLRRGALHPLTRVTNELLEVFQSIGFDVAEGPQVELYEYNFDKLGFPPDHPATDMQDSFFVSKPDADVKTLLRTHTSTIQVREMLRRRPPLAVVAPGTVYRRDDDVTHSPMFFQLEGLLVDENVSFAHLKGVLTLFVQRLFGSEVPVRFRPSYFPFVEPGGEVDIGCVFCRPWEGDTSRTESCRICKSTGWIEVLGCGMVHPVVFEHVGYDPDRYTGFAFGLGIDRIAMLKYGIRDIRLMYENDVRFLAQI